MASSTGQSDEAAKRSPHAGREERPRNTYIDTPHDSMQDLRLHDPLASPVAPAAAAGVALAASGQIDPKGANDDKHTSTPSQSRTEVEYLSAEPRHMQIRVDPPVPRPSTPPTRLHHPTAAATAPTPGQVRFHSPTPSHSDESTARSTSPSIQSHQQTPYHLLNQFAGMGVSDLTNSIIHLYRGEMSRLLAYRVRLDTCTNWAVTVTAAMIVFSLGQDKIPHYFHVVICVFIFIFLLMEGRRHGYYIAVKSRVRQIEAGFYGRVLLGQEFGRSMCGLISTDDPTVTGAEVVDDDYPPREGAALFKSPFVHTRTLHSPSPSPQVTMARAGLSAGLDVRRSSTSMGDEENRSVEEQMEREAASATNRFAPLAPRDIRKATKAPMPIIQPYVNDWTHLLYHSLLYPEVNISLLDSILVRLRRVYILLLLGVLASWIIKVHLDVGLKHSWYMILIVCVVYGIIIFTVSYYLPKQRSKMYAEKHVAAIFMQERKKRMSSRNLIDDQHEKAHWWKRTKTNDGHLRKRNNSSCTTVGSTSAMAAAGAPMAPHLSVPGPYPPSHIYGPLNVTRVLNQSDHMHPGHPPMPPTVHGHTQSVSYQDPFQNAKYWSKHAARYGMENDADL